MNYKDIPIFINSFNRPTFLMQLIYRLHMMDYNNIIIVDNHSTDYVTLAYLDTCPYKIYRVGENKGHTVLWDDDIVSYFGYSNEYYAYTDCDIIPSENCPEDFMLKFQNALNEHKDVDKVGFGLLSAIPDRYFRWKDVIEWESKFWAKPIEGTLPRLYRADIDTTFALYRPGVKKYSHKALRVSHPYVALHLPWYENSERPFVELEYYRTHALPNINSWDSGLNIKKD
jgi:hypothetical protein